MQNEEGLICRFCLTLCYSDYDLVEEIAKNMLNSLSLKLNLDITEKPVMCKNCAGSLQKSFDFKSLCLLSQHKIDSFVYENDIKNLDLSVIYLSKNNDKSEFSIVKNQAVCRFCMQMIQNNSYMALGSEDKHMVLVKLTLKHYFPELNLNITKEPVMCTSCYERFRSYFAFITSCLDAEEKIKKYCEVEEASSKDQINLSDVVQFVSKNETEHNDVSMNTIRTFCENKGDIKSEEGLQVKHFMDIETQELYIKKGEVELKRELRDLNSVQHLRYPERDDIQLLTSSPDTALFTCKMCTFVSNHKKKFDLHLRENHNILEEKNYSCSECAYKTKHKYILKRHMLVHKDATEVTMYRCELCVFQTKLNFLLKQHMLVHKDASELTMFKCDTCPYETKYRPRLKEHKLIHTDTSMVTMYNCELCPHMTKYKASLKRHMVTHKNVSEITMFVCEICAHQSRHKFEFNKHMLRHKDASEMIMYKCDKCDYETKFKKDLKTHGFVHKDVSEVTIFKCEICAYQTKYKRCLKQHILIHKDASEVMMYKCEACPYSSKRKSHLHVHLLTHKSTAEIVMYKCEFCSYESKIKSHLKRHMLKHTDASLMTMYKCAVCALETKYKGSLKKHMLSHSL